MRAEWLERDLYKVSKLKRPLTTQTQIRRGVSL